MALSLLKLHTEINAKKKKQTGNGYQMNHQTSTLVWYQSFV